MPTLLYCAHTFPVIRSIDFSTRVYRETNTIYVYVLFSYVNEPNTLTTLSFCSFIMQSPSDVIQTPTYRIYRISMVLHNRTQNNVFRWSIGSCVYITKGRNFNFMKHKIWKEDRNCFIYILRTPAPHPT